MRLGIVSDTHANLPALEVALAALDDVDAVVCLGDIVGYGPDPVECVRAVRASCSMAIAGNHDLAVRDLSIAEYFNDIGRAAVHWQKGLVDRDPDIGLYLDTLPASQVIAGVRLVHGSPSDPMEYILDFADAAWGFRSMAERIALFGHTHLPIAYELTGGATEPVVRWVRPNIPLALDPAKRYLLNPGSVGQPRDGDPRAAFGVLDTEEMTFTSRRKPYDVRVTVRRILGCGLPPALADRLEVGR